MKKSNKITYDDIQNILNQVTLSKIMSIALEKYGVSSVPHGIEQELAILIHGINIAKNPFASKERKEIELEKKLQTLFNRILQGV